MLNTLRRDIPTQREFEAQLNANAARDRPPYIDAILEGTRDPNGLTTNVVAIHRRADGVVDGCSVAKVHCSEDQREMATVVPALCTGQEWQAAAIDVRMDIALALHLPSESIVCTDMLGVLPASTLAWLAYWQDQVNTGACWFAPWRVGEIAQNLIRDGYLLHGRKRVRTPYGDRHPSRYTEERGKPGTDPFVKAVMGPEYHAWIREIR